MLQENREESTAILTLDYPQRRNALAVPMRARLADALERLEAEREIRAIIITGAQGNFSAGGDVSGMQVNDIASGRERFRLTVRLVELLIRCSKPIIAAVEGWCVGAGLSLALCCDTVVAGSDARFAALFGRVGLMADLGLLFTLPARVGQGRARQILLYGEQFDAATAERIGMIDRVVAPGAALDAARERARVFATAAPLPIAMTKAFLAQGLAEQLQWEREVQSMLYLSADHAEGKAAFLAKRQPLFKGL